LQGENLEVNENNNKLQEENNDFEKLLKDKGENLIR
jgi:hypothetical protein